MKAMKSFSEFIITVWAAIVRTLMARYCVKSLTLKNRPNAWRYLLGAEKELRLIDKLGLADEELQERVWSHETKLELLRRGRSALLSEVKTEEELDAVLGLRNPSMLVKALRVYTPSREKMRELCASLEPLTLMALAKNTPWVFDSLTPLEVLGAKEGEAIATTSDRWRVALALAKVRPSWAPTFIKLLRDVVPSQLGDEGHALMSTLFNIAYDAKVDVSEMMPYFYVFQPDMYARIRANWAEYEEGIAPYFKVLFPQLLKYLKKSVDFSFADIETKGEKISDDKEVYAWLKIGYKRLEEQKVHTLILQNIYDIKKNVQRDLFNQLFERMVETASCSSDLIFLYNVVEKPEETAIPSILVSRMERKEAGTSLRRVFPFEGWHEQLVTRAVKAMVARKEFPVERLGELPEEMQKLAVEEMEIMSQIEAIDKGDVEKLISTTTLYPAAERHLLSKSSNFWKKQQLAYIKKAQLDASTFEWILRSVNLSMEAREEFIFLYAETWKVTETQYLQVMQSWISDKAPFLKSFIKGQPAEA